MWRHLSHRRDLAAAFVDASGIIRQTRRVGDPVIWDTSNTPVHFYMTKPSVNSLLARVRAAQHFGQASTYKGSVFNGLQMTRQLFEILPFTDQLVAIICYRVF